MERFNFYETKCPFCLKKYRQIHYLNIICECNAKFYYIEKVWLNRNTEEVVFCDESNFKSKL